MRVLRIVALICILTGIASCNGQDSLDIAPPELEFAPQVEIEKIVPVDLSPKAMDFIDQVSVRLDEAKYLDLVTSALPLNSAETDLLNQNGFVVTDRYQWNRFIEAYAWIYWQDLPVFISSDSILHAVHQSYSDLLKAMEGEILIEEMTQLMTNTLAAVNEAAAANNESALNSHYEDVQTYLQTALVLISRDALDYDYERNKLIIDRTRVTGSGDVADYAQLAVSADQYKEITLFNNQRTIDFSLFQPRGHYAEDSELSAYFWAMSWLAHIDFRFVEYDIYTSEPIFNIDPLVAAVILQKGIDSSGERSRWANVNQLFDVLVGPSDNTTLPDFDRFLADSGINTPAEMLRADRSELLQLLLANDYGQQRITGQFIQRSIFNDDPNPIPRPASLMLFGQRFAVDSYVLGNVVYDRMFKNGRPIERPLPSTLDAMYALGNDHALTHLQVDLDTFDYSGYLAQQRTQIDGLDPEFWDAPLYNQWLNIIRSLNAPTTDEAFPQAMRTAAWADRTLHTQLASWAQLRHDNILYVKQSFTTSQVLCEYPAGYVEPVPAFYAALYEYALSSHTALNQLVPTLTGTDGQEIAQRALTYFEDVMVIAEQLQFIAEKELRLEEFSPEEEAFVKSVIKRRTDAEYGCAGPAFEETWDGWYANLFFHLDDNPAVIADVHTNPNVDRLSTMYPPTVLHAATGPTVPIFLMVDTDEGHGLYVGPSFTYFEEVTTGDENTPPQRLIDWQWRERFMEGEIRPIPPTWTSSFRLPTTEMPTVLPLPNYNE